jgi:hypothetical protein
MQSATSSHRFRWKKPNDLRKLAAPGRWKLPAVRLAGASSAQRLIIGGASSVSKQCPGFGIVLVTGHGY